MSGYRLPPVGPTPVRFEPADTGTEHFVLKQGAPVRLLDSRPGWHQIARCAGEQRLAKRLIGKIRNSLVDYTDNPQ